MIFFDNASTTKMFDDALKSMNDVCSLHYFNPSALYKDALSVQNVMNDSRHSVARALNASDCEIYFTSCATEANNWVLSSGFKNKKGNIVVSCGEHASVYECAALLKSKGVDVRLVSLNANGHIDMDDLNSKLDENTSLVSIIHCSNETGVINDINAISRLVRSKCKKALIHSDGVQAFLKINTDVKYLGVDFYTVSGHKVGGPKGIGALYIRDGVGVAPLILGGGQERNLRSGTENTPAIAAFATGIACFKNSYDISKIRSIREYILNTLVPYGFIHNGSNEDSGFILSLSYRGIKSEILSHMLSDEEILIGLGSACSARAGDNRVLSAMGKDTKTIEGNIRLSLSVFSTLDEAKIVCKRIIYNLEKLKSNIH